jgi:D-hydroxyproline dehydrogenase subunit gamma
MPEAALDHAAVSPHHVRLSVNGREVLMPPHSTVAAAILAAGESTFRLSVTGAPRGPLCGMGVCMECRVQINGVPHQKSCQILCHNEMEVVTEAPPK